MREVNSILLIEQYGLGDGVLSTPALELLRRDFPQARRVSLASPVVAELRQGCPLVTGVTTDLPVAQSFDLAVDLTGKLRTARLARRSGAPVRVGTAWWPSRRWAGRLYTAQVPRPEGGHVLEHKLEVARAAALACGLLPSPMPVDQRPQVWISDAEREFAQTWLTERGLLAENCLVGMHTGGASRGRSWRARRFAQVCRELRSRYGADVLMVGGSEDLPGALEIARQASGDPWVVAGQTTVGQLAALLSRCQLFIGGDSGPLHLAAAVGLPAVAIFGRSDPAWSGPWGEGHEIVRVELECSPCRGMPHSKWWRRCRRYRCLDLISVEHVLQATSRLLNAVGERQAVAGSR